MDSLTMKKKIEILERSFAASAGAYYSINLSADLVPGTMYQVIDDKEYSINEQIGLPENASFSAVVAYWGQKLPEKERAAYYTFFDIDRLLECFQNGETHVYHRYWTKTALFEPMLAEQHIVMYTDDESGDVLAISYVLDLTQNYKEEQYKKELEENQIRLKKALADEQKAREFDIIRQNVDALYTAVSNISFLDGVSSHEDLLDKLPEMLASMGKFAKADRAYIFDLAPGSDSVLQMIGEWCADGVRPTMSEMQNIAFEDMPNWLPKLLAGEAIISYNWDAEKTAQPEEYSLFDGQDIHSLIVIPLISGGHLKGYMGYDNPSKSNYAVSLQILKAIGGHIVSLRENTRMRMQLEEKQRTLEANLKELNREKLVLDALSVDYSTVSLCDFEEDTVYHLKEDLKSNLPAVNRGLGKENHCFSQRIRFYYNNFIIKESAPDFLDKVNLEYLKEYLKTHDRFAYPFRTKPNPVGHQYFEVQVVPLKGSTKFVMGYRYMDDITAERERQKEKLEAALAEATLRDEIIGSISKLYWLIYRVDLTDNTFDEVSAGEDMHILTEKTHRADMSFRNAMEMIAAAEYQNVMHNFLDLSSLRERLRDTETVSQEYRAKNGSWHLGRFIVKKRDKNGLASNVLYVVRLIDEQKQQEMEYHHRLLLSAEEAKRANIAKTDFLRRMSHDIRTPINGIRGMVSIANHYPTDLEKQQECRNKVMEASGFLLELVNDVLDMNRLESGVIILKETPFNLENILFETMNIIQMQSQEYALTLEFAPMNIRHKHLIGSTLHFRQILQNVAGNAIKYNRPGGRISFTCDELFDDGENATYRITCEDSGRGMSKEFLTRAFEPFAQEDSGARTTYTGTGLGLAITKQLLDLMGGSIQIDSKLGEGTKVTMQFIFPIDKYFVPQPTPKYDISDTSLDGVKVLLVEDNDLNMEIAKFLLEKSGMEVTTVWNGREAADVFAASEEGYFDLILMDIMMPVMNGLDATAAIRSLERSDAKTIPIFAMTANAFPEDIQQSKDAGMNEHLSKPLQEKELIPTIQRYICRK